MNETETKRHSQLKRASNAVLKLEPEDQLKIVVDVLRETFGPERIYDLLMMTPEEVHSDLLLALEQFPKKDDWILELQEEPARIVSPDPDER